MNYIKYLLFLVLVMPLQAQQHFVAIDILVARQLSEIWNRHPADSLGCLKIHFERFQKSDNEPIIVIDSVVLKVMCGPAQDSTELGMVGFITGNYEQDDILNKMQKVLEQRQDLLFVGEVYAVIPAFYEGKRIKMPRIWWAFRY